MITKHNQIKGSDKKVRLSSWVGYFLPLLLSTLTPLLAQDTLSFGGIYDLPGAEVRASYTPVSPLAQRFTIEEVYRLPGTFYDPARLVALLPGVVQTNDQANHLSVRGNTPNANLWRLNGLAIVNPNHTANAGTFYDFPTLSGGGVNAISAQMLGNSGFLAGGLPVEYGFATGGTFDLRLRPGSKTRRKYQAQAGFIGFDLMAEGPIGNSGKTSYLVNGRYSFTGLLADMGVDFGGEEIRFADVNAHLHHEWDGGEVSAFAILGQSSNVFRGPDSTETEITEQKELTDIDFESYVNIFGSSFLKQTERGRFEAGLSYSTTESRRTTNSANPEPFGFEQTNGLDNTLINARIKYDYYFNTEETFSTGIEALNQEVEYLPSGTVFSGGQRIFFRTNINSAAPFVEYNNVGGRHEFSGGIRIAFFEGEELNDFVWEPRMQYVYRIGQGRLAVSAQRVSRLPIASSLLARRFQEDLFVPVSNQADLSYSFRLFGTQAKIGGFYQYTPREYVDREGDFLYSANNLLEFDPLSGGIGLTTTSPTRRYGTELELAGGKKSEGWYYRGSLTLLRAETRQEFLEEIWVKDRYSSDFITKLTVGREWVGTDKIKRPRNYGINFALIAYGGERYGEALPPVCRNCGPQQIVPLKFRNGFLNSTGTYFRPDLRLYKTKTRPKTTTTLALDVQNVANVQNTANVYYDAFLERPIERFQLGLIPVLSYRIVWR